jgi:hypothetical protein
MPRESADDITGIIRKCFRKCLRMKRKCYSEFYIKFICNCKEVWEYHIPGIVTGEK